MRTYIIRRLLLMIPVFCGILFLLFLVVGLAPGGPVANVMDPRATPEMKAELQARLGLDQPLPVRFFNWAREALRGNLGYSEMYKEPVTKIIGQFIGKTLSLTITAAVVALFIGIPAGVVSATKQYSLVDNFFTVLALVGVSIPAFFFGLLLLKFFAVDHQIFPLFGISDPMLRNPTTWEFITDRAYHLFLPVMVMGLASTPVFMRYTRSSMLEVIRQDYIRTARAKGLRERVVIYKHALGNAIIPIITLVGFQIPALFSGAVLTESIFALPGIAKLEVDAIMNRDYNLFMGINAIVAIFTLIGMLAADILYAIADPRIRYD